MRIHAYFIPPLAENARRRLNFLAQRPVFTVAIANRKENPADLRLRADPPGAPFPLPLFAGIQRQGIKAGFAVRRGG
jgi:hypothetical protein